MPDPALPTASSAPQSPDSDTVFVITPIGREGSPERQRADDLMDLVVGPALTGLDQELRPVRADQFERPGSITDAIVEAIVQSRLVIVDLTGSNPNVYYEMGIADSFGKATIRIVDEPGKLPFDTRDHNAIQLRSAEDGRLYAREAEACRDSVKAQVRAALGADFRPTSIVVRHAQTAQLESLAVDLDKGDDQSKALALVLEKLSDFEDRFESAIADDHREMSPDRIDQIAMRIRAVRPRARAILRVLSDVDGWGGVHLERSVSLNLRRSSAFRQAFDELEAMDLLEEYTSAAGNPVLYLSIPPDVVRAALEQARPLDDEYLTAIRAAFVEAGYEWGASD